MSFRRGNLAMTMRIVESWFSIIESEGVDLQTLQYSHKSYTSLER